MHHLSVEAAQVRLYIKLLQCSCLVDVVASEALMDVHLLVLLRLQCRRAAAVGIGACRRCSRGRKIGRSDGHGQQVDGCCSLMANHGHG